MKNYKEMSKDVLNRIDEYETERKIKRAKITKIAASVTPVCAAAVVGVGLWKGGILTTDHDQFIVSNVETTVSDAEQIISENSDVSNNIVENVTNATSSEKVNSTTKETENSNSDSTVVVIPEKEVPDNEGAIPEAPETPQMNIEADNSDTSIENPDNNIPNSEIQQTSENNEISSNDNEENDVCHFMKHVIIDDVGYVEYDAGTETYTPDICLGSPSDYDGNYRAFFSDIPATLYTSKENPEILIVKEPDKIVYLIRTKE